MQQVEQSKTRRQAGVIVVLLLTVFFAASLMSHDPADAASGYVYPANATPQNWCGPVGAWLSALAVELFGAAALVVCLAVGMFGWGLARRAPWGQLAWDAVGFLFVTVSASALLDLLSVPAYHLESVAGAGGMIGALIVYHLVPAVSLFGAYLLLVSVFLVGIVLALDNFVVIGLKGLIRVAKLSARLAGGLVRLPARLRTRFAASGQESIDATEAEEDEVEEEEEAEETDELEDEEESDEEYEDEEDDDEVEWEHPDKELKIVRTGLDGPDALPEAAAIQRQEKSAFELPGLDLLDDPEPFEYAEHEQEVRERAKLLEKTFAEFQMRVKVVQIDTGPVVTQYEIELEPGLRARRVMALSDDLAIAMRAQSVRIVAPIPGRNTVGIEVPNERRAKVTLKEIMSKSPAKVAKMRLPVYLGKDVKGNSLVYDLANMPHLLIAGRTGTGKSVCLNAIILSVLMTRTPDQVKMLMIDPKMVELSQYRDIPHLLHPVVTDMKKAEALLAWAVEKMDERYALLARAGVRHIDAYNKLDRDELYKRLGVDGDDPTNDVPEQLPYLLIFTDEMADLMMTAAKEVEAHIIRLAQKSRAVGIHLCLATQKPTVDVVTGLIKSNLPARIGFQVASRSDSRVVLDECGADKLLGNGDMLFLYPGTSKIVRAQGTYVSDEEVTCITDHLASQARPEFSKELIELRPSSSRADGVVGNLSERDEFYEQAVEVVVREQRGSVSLLQRALGIGYGRAARLVDYMAEDGIVGEYNGSQAREVLYNADEWEDARESLFAST